MPVYEYRCEACGKKSSVLLATFSSPEPDCPHCGKHELRRLVSTFATVSSGDDFGGGGDDDFDGGADGDFDGGGEDFGGDDDF